MRKLITNEEAGIVIPFLVIVVGLSVMLALDYVGFSPCLCCDAPVISVQQTKEPPTMAK